MGTRTERRAWLNGRPGRLGYLGQLRVDRSIRGLGGGLCLGGAFHYLGQLDRRRRSRPYFALVDEHNTRARQMLERDWPGLPRFRRRGVFCTLALPLSRPRPTTSMPGLEIRRAAAPLLPEIAACLQRNYAAYQLAPHWTAGDLAHPTRTRDLRPEHFWVALFGGKLVGCLAAWDQQRYKQTVVHGYSGALGRLAEAAARRGDRRFFPAPGEPLSHVHLSHVAVDGADGQLLLALLDAAHNHQLQQGQAYLTTGFAEDNPLLKVVKAAFPHLQYRAVLYLAFWEEGAAAVGRLDGRLPHLEAAVL
jgi:hypothetical protein